MSCKKFNIFSLKFHNPSKPSICGRPKQSYKSLFMNSDTQSLDFDPRMIQSDESDDDIDMRKNFSFSVFLRKYLNISKYSLSSYCSNLTRKSYLTF